MIPDHIAAATGLDCDTIKKVASWGLEPLGLHPLAIDLKAAKTFAVISAWQISSDWGEQDNRQLVLELLRELRRLNVETEVCEVRCEDGAKSLCLLAVADVYFKPENFLRVIGSLATEYEQASFLCRIDDTNLMLFEAQPRRAASLPKVIADLGPFSAALMGAYASFWSGKASTVQGLGLGYQNRTRRAIGWFGCLGVEHGRGLWIRRGGGISPNEIQHRTPIRIHVQKPKAHAARATER